MKIIKIAEGQYVRTKAIRIIKADIGLATEAPPEVRVEWEARLENPNNYFENMLLPTIKVSLVASEETVIYFASEEVRDKHLADLIANWQSK